MASDDHDERVRGALAVALAVILTYKKRRRARTLAEWALVLDVLEDIHKRRRRGKRARTAMVPVSSDSASPPTIGFLPGAVVYNIMLRKAELKRHDSSNFRRHFRIPYELSLEFV